MKTKICTKCGLEKKLSEFSKNSRYTGNRLKSRCKLCISIYNKKYRDENKEKIKIKKKQDYEDNKEYILTRNKNWLKKNKVKMDKYLKEYRIENKEQIQIKVKEYKIRNKEKINKQSVQKRKDDSNFKILVNLRTRLSKALKGQSKSKKTLDLLGCTIEELKKHLQTQFTRDMNWDNYGLNGWEIDHRIPCASFDFTDSKQQEACFNYTNLKPLWAIDNRIKSNKF